MMMAATHIRQARGRPRGSRRDSFTSFVSAHGQFTLCEVATRLGMSVREADQVLRRALSSNEIRPAGTTRTPDAKRPVLVYEPVVTRQGQASGAVALAMQLRCWGR